MEESAMKCQSINAYVPLGYAVGEDRKFHIDPITAPIVKNVFKKYVAGIPISEICKYVDSKGIKTMKGNTYGKNNIRTILSNKRYIGIYIYKDKEIAGGMPKIISQKIFAAAQLKLEKNKIAPARNKAVDSYLLTTKLFCGLCKHPMTGISGRGRSGKKYCYYVCTEQKDTHNCTKSRISKQKLEDLVVAATMEILTDERIEVIARNVVNYSKKGQNDAALKSLKRKIKDNKKATDNLLKALESGKINDIILSQIAKKEEELRQLEYDILQEQNNLFTLTASQVQSFLYSFKNGNINDPKYRKALIDVFVRRIIIKEKKMAIYYNVQKERSIIAINNEHPSTDECYYLGRVVEHTGVEPVAS